MINIGKRYLTTIYSIISLIAINLLFVASVNAGADNMSLFPLNNYPQDLSQWFNPNAKDYDTIILDSTTQQQHVTNLLNHYFGATSPWNAQYVTRIVTQAAPNDLYTVEASIIA